MRDVLAAACLVLFAALRAAGTGDDDAALGGAATVVADGPEAFDYPVPALTAEQRRAFVVGNALFRTNWVSAPASVEGVDGLGPLYNARSCSSCHFKDGRGRPPRANEEGATGLIVRLSSPTYGRQLQDHAIEGARAEGRLVIDEESVHGRYTDGSPWELSAPHYRIVDAAYGPLDATPPLSPRVAPQMVGLGLLENVPESAIVALADPDDRDHDGVKGRARFVDVDGVRRLGRFGWKASQPTVRAQVAAAFANDMGLTSRDSPHDDATDAERAAWRGVPNHDAPELSDLKIDRVAFYSAVLAVPARRNVLAPEVVRGEKLFTSLGCVRCHVSELETGDGGEVAGLRRQRIHPYTDLLLHDLGPRLADSLQDDGAGMAEWRTPPLWGIGLFATVNQHHRYLHDGRARNLEEAVLWHGGEAERASKAFQSLGSSERTDLVAFLQSL